jgi:hypothetical protein
MTDENPEDDGPVKFDFRRVENPGSTTCPACSQTVSLPQEEPWVIVGGVALPPSGLVSFPCPNCRTRIYLTDVDEERRRYDAEVDAQPVGDAAAGPTDRERS